MGYSHYFYKVSKSEVENVKNLTLTELRDYAVKQGVELYDDFKDDDSGFYFGDDSFMSKEYVFDFGNLDFKDIAERIYDKGVPLFSKQETQDAFCDHVPYVVGREGVLEAINAYKENVEEYYKTLNEADDIGEIKAHISHKLMWLKMGLVKTDGDIWTLTRSWEYEHSVFNLVHLLKMIDWDKDTILFYGS